MGSVSRRVGFDFVLAYARIPVRCANFTVTVVHICQYECYLAGIGPLGMDFKRIRITY